MEQGAESEEDPSDTPGKGGGVQGDGAWEVKEVVWKNWSVLGGVFWRKVNASSLCMRLWDHLRVNQMDSLAACSPLTR